MKQRISVGVFDAAKGWSQVESYTISVDKLDDEGGWAASVFQGKLILWDESAAKSSVSENPDEAIAGAIKILRAMHSGPDLHVLRTT